VVIATARRMLAVSLASVWIVSVLWKARNPCDVIAAIPDLSIPSRVTTSFLVLAESATAQLLILGRERLASCFGLTLLLSFTAWLLTGASPSGMRSCGCLPGVSESVGIHVAVNALLMAGHVVVLLVVRPASATQFAALERRIR